MTRMLSLTAFAVGVVVILWMTQAVAVGHLLAFVVMLLIALAYCAGASELWAYQRGTSTLNQALKDAPNADLESWLARIPDALRDPVRQRIAGEGRGLPVPVLTPYLVGLLVMLGLMGTFVGMVETLGGAVRALEGSTELSAIRAGLAAPIQGLGMAFGTSVAGVAASAMLGFIATLSRRERLAACRELDHLRDTCFREQSLPHQRQLTYRALQQQAEALPGLVSQLAVLGEHLGTVGERLDQRGGELEQQLLARQEQFQQRLQDEFRELASSVARALQTSLAESGRQAGETVKPLVEGLLSGLEQNLRQRHQLHDDTALARLEAMDAALRESREAVAASWQQGLEQQQRSNRELMGAVEQTLARAAAQLVETAQARDGTLAALNQQLLEQQTRQMAAQQAAEQRWQQNVENRSLELMNALQAQLQELQTATAQQLAELGHSLEAPLAEVVTASLEAPRAASQLIEQLRAAMSAHLARDNTLLEDRQALLQEFAALITALGDGQRSQQEALEQLLARSGDSLENLLAGSGENLGQWLEHSGASLEQLNQRVGDSLEQSSARILASLERHGRQLAESLTGLGGQVADNLEQRGRELAGLGEQLSGSALEMAGLGETFAAAVQQFSASNGELQAALASVEQTLAESGERSDEQMAYYVAQAREIIDHNLVSQQAILARLEELAESAAGTPRRHTEAADA